MTHTSDTNAETSAAEAVVPDLAALYDRHREKMFRAAALVLRGSGASYGPLDAVNDAIISIMKSPPEPDEVRSWEAFLVTAAKRKAIDHLRSAHAQHAVPFADPLEAGDEQGGANDVADEVIHELERQQTVERVQECLAVLDERHRYVLWEIVGMGRSREQVADDLGVSPPRVSQIKKRALTLLQQELARREEGDDG